MKFNNDYVIIKSFIILVNNESNHQNKINNLNLEFKNIPFKAKNIEFYFLCRTDPNKEINSNCNKFIYGDDSESGLDNTNMSNAALITFDIEKNNIDIFTSIVGLPPVYIYNFDEYFCLTSDIHLLRSICGMSLKFDSKGLFDLCTIGHFTDGGTLFDRVLMAKPGHKYFITRNDSFEVECKKTWFPSNQVSNYSWNEFCEEQISLFDESIQKLDSKGSFLSLTAGLDTRAILAGLIKRNIDLPPAYTLTGKNRSLDSETAHNLSNHYSFNHKSIALGDCFINKIDKYVLDASKLSGGSTSFLQAHEVYFYEQVGVDFDSRISGNFGNQIGRGGTEGTSVRNGETGVFNHDFISTVASGNKKHWLSHLEGLTYKEKYHLLLTHEIPNSMSGNYSIGNSFAIQKTPYASKKLIDFTFNRPDIYKHTSLSSIKMNDLKHRFFGEESNISFQRKYVNRVGGFVSHYPINWGWRSAGGTSVLGKIKGLICLIDITQSKSNFKLLNLLSDNLGITGRHVFLRFDNWLDVRFKKIILDIIFAYDDNNEMFNHQLINKLVDDHFNGKGYHLGTILFLIDVSAARINFID